MWVYGWVGVWVCGWACGCACACVCVYARVGEHVAVPRSQLRPLVHACACCVGVWVVGAWVCVWVGVWVCEWACEVSRDPLYMHVRAANVGGWVRVCSCVCVRA